MYVKFLVIFLDYIYCLVSGSFKKDVLMWLKKEVILRNIGVCFRM